MLLSSRGNGGQKSPRQRGPILYRALVGGLGGTLHVRYMGRTVFRAGLVAVPADIPKQQPTSFLTRRGGNESLHYQWLLTNRAHDYKIGREILA